MVTAISPLISISVFDNPTGSRLGLIGAFPGFGGFAVLLFTPYIADFLGRRTGTAIGCLLVILGSIIQALASRSNPVPMFLAGRWLMGMGSNISNATCPLLITEIAHPRHRGRVTTIYNTLWYLGAIIAAWTTYGTLMHIETDLSWRLPVGLQCAMPGLQLLAIYSVAIAMRMQRKCWSSTMGMARQRGLWSGSLTKLVRRLRQRRRRVRRVGGGNLCAQRGIGRDVF
jgi:MFS family permease